MPQQILHEVWFKHLLLMQETQPECFTVAEPAEQLQAGFRNWWSRDRVFVIVDSYANFIGSIGGIVLSIVLLAVWLVIGSVMGYSNDNWWLIIGTYTGLVRLHASFFCKSSNAQTDIIDNLESCLSVQNLPSSVVFKKSLMLWSAFVQMHALLCELAAVCTVS